MHCLDTISKLNREAARPSRPSATYRIKALRALYLQRLDNLGESICPDYRVIAAELETLISRIERDEKEVS